MLADEKIDEIEEKEAAEKAAKIAANDAAILAHKEDFFRRKEAEKTGKGSSVKKTAAKKKAVVKKAVAKKKAVVK